MNDYPIVMSTYWPIVLYIQNIYINSTFFFQSGYQTFVTMICNEGSGILQLHLLYKMTDTLNFTRNVIIINDYK